MITLIKTTAGAANDVVVEASSGLSAMARTVSVIAKTVEIGILTECASFVKDNGSSRESISADRDLINSVS